MQITKWTNNRNGIQQELFRTMMCNYKGKIFGYLAGVVVFVGDEMFVEDEEDDEDDGHDEGHEAEGVPRPVSRVQIGDADRAQHTGQTGARTQNAHPSALVVQGELNLRIKLNLL